MTPYLILAAAALLLGLWARRADRRGSKPRVSPLSTVPQGRAVAIAEYQRRVDATRRKERAG